MKKILLIGQGIAGTLLAHFLQQRGADVHIVDAGHSETASTVAAGVINPITGKRYVKTWMLEALLSAAHESYQQLEQLLNVRLWHDHRIIRLLGSVEEANNWAERASTDANAPFMNVLTDGGAWTEHLQPGFLYGELRQAARVNLSLLIRTYRKKWQTEGVFEEKRADAAWVEQQLYEYDHVIFCEGHRIEPNLWYQNTITNLLQPAKGEALLIRLQHPKASQLGDMLKKNLIVVPMGNGLFWVGSHYDWQFENAAPTDAGKKLIVNELKELLITPFEVITHRAAIRPTTKDRRPLIGLWPDNPKIGLFNGLGTKGTLLAPYWAKQFAAHLLEGSALSAEVGLERVRSTVKQ